MVGRALISVHDKTGLEELAGALGRFGVEFVASSGTAAKLRELGHEVTEVSDYTGYPESPGGLLKTLHPKIHGGLLLDGSNPAHRSYMERHGIEPFDFVVVNLYPFEAAMKKRAELREAADNIDIGGPTMIRAAAKAALLYDKVAVVVDPSQYKDVIDALEKNDGNLPTEMRRRLAREAFMRTSAYDAAICEYLARVD
jgi:phosphoribosylaminoimidazolecarboxamide formyltransferase/IMP cyclohydrolase